MAKRNNTAKTEPSVKVDHINVRMYRMGTGDFFLLQFKKKEKTTFNLLIDCGCIQGKKEDFINYVRQLAKDTLGVIDLLVVTHEHADHINGFQMASEVFDKEITIKKVWFAWTESKEDNLANDLRENHSAVRAALTAATEKLTGLLKDKYFESIYQDDHNFKFLQEGKKVFIASLGKVNNLNINREKQTNGSIPTMEDLLRSFGVIKNKTIVKFCDPGEKFEDLPGAEGIRFFVLGPPKAEEWMKAKEKKGEGYEKRQQKSTVDLAFLNAVKSLEDHSLDTCPFDDEYIADNNDPVKQLYSSTENQWRSIEHDWLFSAGSLALKYESSVNNTSLVLAIQFIGSERVLLFTGDAETANWKSWHEGLNWKIKVDGKAKTVDAKYLLNNTVFYKVGHHLSQNGTAKEEGLEMMPDDNLGAMVALDFRKIMPGWLNTMPNDIIGAELIRKTKGNVLLLGEREKILKNIRTNRVSVNSTHLKSLNQTNARFDGNLYMDYLISE
jgi:beta-lactamase superfamily II metal-dependent hydrolase